jgi:hypothetical protein
MRLASAPLLHMVSNKTGSTIDDIAREVKALALLLPDSTAKGRVNTTDVRKDAKRAQTTCVLELRRTGTHHKGLQKEAR